MASKDEDHAQDAKVISALREKLAAVTRERDNARAREHTMAEQLATVARERDALRGRLAVETSGIGLKVADHTQEQILVRFNIGEALGEIWISEEFWRAMGVAPGWDGADDAG